MLRSIVVLLSCFVGVLTAFHPDEVKHLPGYNRPLNFKHYSGYLNATRGKYLHYWFVESQRSPSTDPVLLWLNGGPGCSSLDGFLSELGPLHVSPDGKTLYKNPYSWNRIANVIFLEAPVGVGFSYADNDNYFSDDDSTSYNNYVAIQNFFEKFPQFKKNDFYITGESYAGVYIPTLSVRVLSGPAKINFKGFAIGNGLLDVKNQTNSIVFFAYHHGLIGRNLWNKLTKYCCGGVGTIERCNFAYDSSPQCQDIVSEVTDIALDSDINMYNLYADCVPFQEQDGNSRYLVDRRGMLLRFQKSKNEGSSDPPCTYSANIRNWINQPCVRAALHIPSHVQDWEQCSWEIENTYEKIYDTMRPQMLQMLASGKLRGLIYNGDVDIICNFLGDEWFADGLGLQVTKEYGWWRFNNQIAGFFKSYGPLTFLTVKGSGHMVPQDKPGPAFKMIDNFLSNKPYD